MEHFDVQFSFANTRHQLHMAACVAGHQYVSPGCGNIFHFSIQDSVGNIVLDNVIDPGASAAPVWIAQFNKFKTGNQLK